MNISPEKLWDKCLAFISKNISEQTYNTWFKSIVFEAFNEEKKMVVIRVPSHFVCEYLEEHYVKLLHVALSREFGSGIQLSYRIVTDKENKQTQTMTLFSGTKWLGTRITTIFFRACQRVAQHSRQPCSAAD